MDGAGLEPAKYPSTTGLQPVPFAALVTILGLRIFLRCHWTCVIARWHSNCACRTRTCSYLASRPTHEQMHNHRLSDAFPVLLWGGLPRELAYFTSNALLRSVFLGYHAPHFHTAFCHQDSSLDRPIILTGALTIELWQIGTRTDHQMMGLGALALGWPRTRYHTRFHPCQSQTASTSSHQQI